MTLKVDITSFSYSDQPVLRDVHFTLEPGIHLSIIGESGCGKSTLIHIIYGLLHLEQGTVFYGDKKLRGPLHSLIPGEPFMKLVAQEFNIMPFITVAENVGTYLSSVDREYDKNRILELLRVVEMEGFENTLVKNLSGGQKQRVALAKTLAREPEILLLDEPFSNIDTSRKNRLRRRLFNYLKEKGIGCITATHDSMEALAFSDQILMLKNGAVEMMGTPEEIYNNVSDEYQAGFFDEVNLLSRNLFMEDNTSREIIIFPYQLHISSVQTKLQVTVENCYFKGNHYLIQSRWDQKEIFFENPQRLGRKNVFYLKYRP